jgi:tetraacyldisaccharide 4'-kinase
MSDPYDLDDPPAGLLPLLSAAALAYGGGLRVRRALYDWGVVRVDHAPCPVVSVGNVTVGGNGKTPLTLLLVERLRALGRRPAVVSRGYGGTVGEGVLRVEPHTSAAHAGDEPVLLARRSGVPVYVSPRRIEGARVAAAAGADVVVLDDGFQHWALARALDVVVVDAAHPFGRGQLLPAGRLREPRAALARADVVVVHRGLMSAPTAVVGVRGDVEVAVSPVELLPVGTATTARPLSALAGARVALAAAIARPERFEATVVALGAQVVARHFVRDHAPLAPQTLASLAAQVDMLLMTEKDAARLAPRALLAPAWALRIDLGVLAGGDVLEAALRGALAAKEGR